MEDFSYFYQCGGVFNHLVSLFGLAALTTLVMHAVGRRNEGDSSLLRLGERFTALAVASGVLGTLFGVMEMSAALATVPDEMAAQASNRAMGIVPIPLVWSLLCAIPLWLATGCMRYRGASVA
jgi:hypothetical protein